LSSIKAESLTYYEVAADGTHCRLCFVDRDGAEQAVEFPVACLQQLMLTIPKIACEALRGLYNDASLELVHIVDSWQVRSAPGRRVLLTLTTPDGFSISFSISSRELGELAEAAVEYEVEAFPEGLRFPRH
jgi:hypothetical protein